MSIPTKDGGRLQETTDRKNAPRLHDPPTITTRRPNPTATIEEIDSADLDEDAKRVEVPAPSSTVENLSNHLASSASIDAKASSSRPTFADMKKSRGSKPTFAKDEPSPKPSRPVASSQDSRSISVAPSSAVPPPAHPRDERPFEPPSDPTSTAPGSGLALLRHLHPPSVGWSALQHYPPQNVPVILGPLLEPDSLAQLLAALHHGLSSGSVDDESRTRVKTIMQDLRRVPRWKVNSAMLSKAEREMGRTIWEACGAEGSWP